MTSVPVKDGKKCVFRVIRVSGTIRKSEQELIRRAQEIIDKARRTIINENDSNLLDASFCPDGISDNISDNKN